MELYEYEVIAAEAGSEAGLEGGLKAELNRLGARHLLRAPAPRSLEARPSRHRDTDGSHT